MLAVERILVRVDRNRSGRAAEDALVAQPLARRETFGSVARGVVDILWEGLAFRQQEKG